MIFDDWRSGDYGTVHTHWAKPGSQWVNVGGTGKWQRYSSGGSYPAGSYRITAAGSSHSPADIAGLPNYSVVVGRTGSSYYHGFGGVATAIQPDPFIRFFLFPWFQ